MIIDGLLYLGTSHFGSALSARDALDGMDAVGIDAAVVVSAHPRGADFAEANARLMQAANESDGRFVALARIDPWLGELASAQLRREVSDGARGLFLHPQEENFQVSAPFVRPLVETAGDLGVPVVIAAGYHARSEPLQLAEVASWVPQIPVVLTNGGQFNISGLSGFDATLALRSSGNVIVHTSAMYREDYLKSVVDQFGDGRLMFASASPQFTWEYELARVHYGRFGTAEESILGTTAARVFEVEL